MPIATARPDMQDRQDREQARRGHGRPAARRTGTRQAALSAALREW